MATEVGTKRVGAAAPAQSWLRRRLALVLAGAVAVTAVALYLASSTSHSYVHSVLASDPAAYWRMDSTACCHVPDASGNGHRATFYKGPVRPSKGLVAGGDRAIRLDGNYLVARGVMHWGLAQPFTLAAWVELPSRKANQVIASVHVGTASGFLLMKQRERLGSRFLLQIDKQFWVRGKVLAANKPQYLAVTYNGKHVYSLYENGKLVARRPRAPSLGFHQRRPLLVLGAADTAGSWPARGVLDDVAVWDRVLPASEIARQYTLGVG